MASEAIRLNLFETRALFDLATRGAGSYEVRIAPQSNSMFSTLFLSAIDAGTTITVDYRESTTGDEEGEDYIIASHTIPTAGPTGVNKLTVAPHHNKPRLEVTITGGTARFGVYVTSVSSFAVDFSQALVHDGAVINLINSGGLMPSIYDPSDGKAYLARGTHGVLDVNVVTPGTVTGTQKAIFSQAIAVAISATATVGSYTVPTGKSAKLQKIKVGGENIATFTVYKNSILINILRTGHTKYSHVEDYLPAGLTLAAGDLIEVKVFNYRPDVGSFETLIQYLEN